VSVTVFGLPLVQVLHSGAFDRGDMDEDVRTAGVWPE
jgi:hypothetical protein